MTSANTLSELFSFEKYFENVALIFLKEDCSVEVFASASLENFVTPRLEISFRAMEATEPSDSPISLGLDEYRKYQANLELVGKVRASLLRTQPNWNATNLPFYGVKLIRQNSFDRTTDGDLELSILNYDLYFSIRDSAFPTTTTTPAP